jgi:hypothetical protein
VQFVGTFPFAERNGHQSFKQNNLVRLSQVKLLVGFQLNFTGVAITIPYAHIAGMSAPLHNIASRARI